MSAQTWKRKKTWINGPMFKWVITNIHTQSTIIMANLHPDNNSRSPMFDDKTSSKWWRKNKKGRLDQLQHTEIIQVQMQNSQWVKLQKPTTNQWVSNSEGCNTAAEEEVLMCVVSGGLHRDG